jgi:Mg2+ and Co2+ transporter CorA
MKKTQKALSTLVMAISTPQLYLVTSCEQPKEVWDALKKQIERANKLFLKKQYYSKEIKEATSVDAHLREMKELTDKLASIGAPISKEDQVVTPLGSLPPSYSTLVTALEAQADEFRSAALAQEEMKRKESEKGYV